MGMQDIDQNRPLTRNQIVTPPRIRLVRAVSRRAINHNTSSDSPSETKSKCSWLYSIVQSIQCYRTFYHLIT